VEAENLKMEIKEAEMGEDGGMAEVEKKNAETSLPMSAMTMVTESMWREDGDPDLPQAYQNSLHMPLRHNCSVAFVVLPISQEMASGMDRLISTHPHNSPPFFLILDSTKT